MSGQEALWNDPEDEIVLKIDEVKNRHKKIAWKEIPI